MAFQATRSNWLIKQNLISWKTRAYRPFFGGREIRYRHLEKFVALPIQVGLTLGTGTGYNIKLKIPLVLSLVIYRLVKTGIGFIHCDIQCRAIYIPVPTILKTSQNILFIRGH